MWIRSQTKGELIPIKHKLSIVCEHDRATLEDKYLICHKEDILGAYATKERAIEILDEIQNLLVPKVKVNTYNVENKETAYNKEIIIEPVIKDIKVQNNINLFYEMPEE